MYIMKSDKTLDVPRYTKLLQPVFSAIKELGGSARNDEILNRVIKSGRHTIKSVNSRGMKWQQLCLNPWRRFRSKW